MLDLLNHTLFHLFGAATSVAEVLGFLSGAACVWLVVRQNVWTFPLGAINAVLFGILFFAAGLYADGSLQIVYLVLQVFGWYAWLRFGPAQTQLRVTTASRAVVMTTAAGVALGTVVLTYVLRAVDDTAPFWDALTTAMSLGAQTLLSYKKLENWWLWIAADIIYIPLYVSKGLVLTSLVYVIFLGMCVAGLVEWRRHLAPETAAEPERALVTV
ncbi:MAG: nicotinamide mononucleotide transporter [Solirubrobacteraceae bacterium]|jgi:nicotinamide mononucleotide transporter|nr:nicotinamide mononucleotide transporter [Solirubrobacteraceae bacterium]